MAEFQPVNIRKYLYDPRKRLDITDRIAPASNSVSNVKLVSGESSEKNDRATEAEGYNLATHNSSPSIVKGTPGLMLHGPILLNLLRWLHKFNELTLEHPEGLTRDVTPEVALGLINTQPWVALYDIEGYLLLTNGSVPLSALQGKYNLNTGELLIPEAVAA